MRTVFTIIFLLAFIPSASHGPTDMQHGGYINHIITDALLETGVQVEYVSMPWEEALEATLAGEYDALSYGNFVRSRESEFFHSKPISAESLVFYVNSEKEIRTWSELSDIADLKMGITEGYLYNDEIAAFIEGNENVVRRGSDQENLEALINGDIDIFPIDELTGWYLLEREFTDAERVPKGRQNSQLVLSLFNKGIDELTLEGKLTRFKRLLKEGYYQHPQKKVHYDRR